MKIALTILGAILIVSSTLISCSDRSENTSSIEKKNSSIDLCRCLTEPGDSEWAKQNKDACRIAISKELGVANYEQVNFSKEPALNRKWDKLIEKCTGTSEVKTGVAAVDKNSALVKHIGTSYGYIWEYINKEAQIYTTLAFDGLIFRTSSYSMHGESNSENFTKLIDLTGNWEAIDAKNAEGLYDQNKVSVTWAFSDDYSYVTNNKGAIFKRIKVK